MTLCRLATPKLHFAQLSFILFATKMFSGASSAHREPYFPPDPSALSSDAKHWYDAGISNANKDVDQFSSKVAEPISEGASPSTYAPVLKSQLQTLLAATKEANDNMQVLVPRLSGLVDSLATWSQDPICLWAKMKLKATLWFIDGKRDNKSYYLLNGGGLWAKLRADILAPVGKDEGKKLKEQLEALQEAIFLARDELDDAAQVYVKGVKRLIVLVQDVGQNGAEIRQIVTEMKKSGDERSPRILQSGNDAVAEIEKRIAEL